MNKPQIIKKAYDCWYIWSDNAKCGPYDLAYGDTPSQARYQFNLSADGDPDTFLEARSRRNPAFDLVAHTPHPLLESLTAVQIKKMDHAIGHDYKSVEPYRNYYQVPFDSDWEDLIKKGMAIKQAFYANCYHLTDLGLDVILSTQPTLRHIYDAKVKSTATA